MRGPDGPTPPQVLEHFLTYSAGLGRIQAREQIISAYPTLYQSLLTRHRFRQAFLSDPHHVALAGFPVIADMLNRHPPRETIVASSYYGRPIACACMLARAGIPVTLAYRSMSPVSQEILRANRVDLLDLGASRSPQDLFRALNDIRGEGRYITILIDAPHPSRRLHDFLGYRVSVSSLLAVYARSAGVQILPLFTALVDDRQITAHAGPMLPCVLPNLTQTLLNLVCSAIARDGGQYGWTSSCIIYADPAARANAKGFLTEALAARAAVMRT